MRYMACKLTPISGHPVAAVTARPVAVLAVGHIVLLQLVLHLLLDLDDLPGIGIEVGWWCVSNSIPGAL